MPGLGSTSARGLSQAAHISKGCKQAVAQKSAYTYLARRGLVDGETTGQARDRSLQAIHAKYPETVDNPDVPLVDLANEAVADAIRELMASGRKVVLVDGQSVSRALGSASCFGWLHER